MDLKKCIYKLLLLERKKSNLIGPPLHKNEVYNPFFIVGSGRSGNTLLRRILNSHSELYIPPETYVLGNSIRQSLRYPQLSWHDLVSLIYSNFEFHQEYETFKMGSLNKLYQRVSKIDKSKRSIAYILNAFYEEYRNEHNIESMRWGDKTPLNTFAMYELKDVFPNAKFIHIIRNPYDSIASYLKSGIYNDIERATFRWRKSVEEAFEFGEKYPNIYFELTYEDLVTNTNTIVKKICSFLDIDYESQMLEEQSSTSNLGDVNIRKHHEKVTKPIDINSIGKGLKSLKTDDVMTINEIINASKNKRVRRFLNG